MPINKNRVRFMVNERMLCNRNILNNKGIIIQDFTDGDDIYTQDSQGYRYQQLTCNAVERRVGLRRRRPNNPVTYPINNSIHITRYDYIGYFIDEEEIENIIMMNAVDLEPDEIRRWLNGMLFQKVPF